MYLCVCYRDPSTWTAEDVDHLGRLVFTLSPKQMNSIPLVREELHQSLLSPLDLIVEFNTTYLCGCICVSVCLCVVVCVSGSAECRHSGAGSVGPGALGGQ